MASKYDSKGDLSLVVVSSTLMGCYLMLLAVTLGCLKLYLYKQRRSTQVFWFYVCAVSIEIARLLQWTNVLSIYAEAFDSARDFWTHAYVFNFCYVVAMFLKLIVGFYQVLDMVDLDIRLSLAPSVE